MKRIMYAIKRKKDGKYAVKAVRVMLNNFNFDFGNLDSAMLGKTKRLVKRCLVESVDIDCKVVRIKETITRRELK